MKFNQLLYLDLKGQKNFSINLYKNYVIQKNNVRCENYAIGLNADIYLMDNQDKKNNSIYGTGYFSTTVHTQVLSEELVKEVNKYGAKLYKLCNKYFKFYNIQMPIINSDIILNSINTDNANKILEIFCDWCKNYGFPIEPIEYSFLDSEIKYYELTFEQIKHLTVQFIIIYLLNTFYEDLCFIFSNKTSDYYLEENQIFKIRRINKFSKLFNINIEKLDENFFNKSTREKNHIKNTILKDLIVVFNQYSVYFNSSSEKYFSYLNGKIYYQNKFSNILDICWDYISQNYISFAPSTRKCADCHENIPAITNKKYCNECSNNISRSKKCHENKLLLMQEIIDYFSNYSDCITNKEVLDRETSIIEQYGFIVSKKRGFSKKLEKTTKKELNDYYEHLKQLVFKYNQY